VAACAVVAKPDEKWGEPPAAFIELTPNVPTPTAGKIQKFQPRERAKGG
jgi:fatty-acyl-CoA synthase